VDGRVRADEGYGSGLQRLLKEVASANEGVPRRLKPDCESSVYGTDESVP
jgi:hypothetical protein